MDRKDKTTQISVRINTKALENIQEYGLKIDRSRNYLINKTLVEKFLSNTLVQHQ